MTDRRGAISVICVIRVARELGFPRNAVVRPIRLVRYRPFMLISVADRAAVTNVGLGAERREQPGASAVAIGRAGEPKSLADSRLERVARIGIAAIDQHLEVEMRSRRQPGRADEADRLSDAHARAGARATRVASQVRVSRDDTAEVGDLHEIPVATTPSGEDDDPVADGPHRRSRCGGVIDPAVLAPAPEDRVEAHPERARYAAEVERRAEKGRAKRAPAAVDVRAAPM